LKHFAENPAARIAIVALPAAIIGWFYLSPEWQWNVAWLLGYVGAALVPAMLIGWIFYSWRVVWFVAAVLIMLGSIGIALDNEAKVKAAIDAVLAIDGPTRTLLILVTFGVCAVIKQLWKEGNR
jgi:hypothetical protein